MLLVNSGQFNWENFKFVNFWWFVRGTLLMESGLLRDFLGNFSTRGERYYFHVEGHVRWM